MDLKQMQYFTCVQEGNMLAMSRIKVRPLIPLVTRSIACGPIRAGYLFGDVGRHEHYLY
jgi:hypothetical protein